MHDRAPASGRRWYHRIGPGLITACVVIGPGSILTSSNVGATAGYSQLWVILLAVLFMMVYMTMGARLGAVAAASPGDLVAARAGRPLALILGLSVFFISASFQFGNNLGVHSAFTSLVQETGFADSRAGKAVLDYGVVIGFNAISIIFLFAFRNLYLAVERLMSLLVAIMLLAFALNLYFAQPDLGELFEGFVPIVGQESEPDISLLGLVGTTFVISAAYYQAYLVRQKGWSKAEMADGLRDARVGSVIMFLITLMLMSTAAAQLRGEKLEDVAAVADGLQPLFGNFGKPLFCLGLFAAAYSSFLVNSMIGGFILSDGLGVGAKPTDMPPRLLTAAVLTTGMVVALWIISLGANPVALIVAAQAATVLAAPLLAAALWWLTSSRQVMGEDRNGPATNIAAAFGFALLLAMAGYTAGYKVWPAISKLM